ncbi:hypothetical protein [Marinicella sediminis]|uniref:hypothetical protein n=1 Tax=Marinicella sediminis TaxID=1792834 RepID=UPI000985FA53|nr:hypothetical protein [Marinicella sediminis]
MAQKNRLRSMKTMSLALADCVSQPPSMGASRCLSFYGAKKPAALDKNNESGSGRLRQPTAIHGRISLPFILWRKKTGCTWDDVFGISSRVSVTFDSGHRFHAVS